MPDICAAVIHREKKGFYVHTVNLLFVPTPRLTFSDFNIILMLYSLLVKTSIYDSSDPHYTAAPYSDFIASIAEILVARSAGKKPESTPTIIPKNAAKKGSQNGITENDEPSATPMLPLMSD